MLLLVGEREVSTRVVEERRARESAKASLAGRLVADQRR